MCFIDESQSKARAPTLRGRRYEKQIGPKIATLCLQWDGPQEERQQGAGVAFAAMNPLLIKQFDYDLWANKLWLEFLLNTETSDSFRKIMGHILGAQAAWVSRIEGESPTSIPLPSLELSTLDTLYARWKAVLDFRAADEVIEYKRLSGESVKSTFEEIALHVVNHGTYHRGELRGLCRSDGHDGFPETDRIRFTLEQAERRRQ